MRFGVKLNASAITGPRLIETARAAEDLGFDSLWNSESYGSDAVSPLAWAGAHTERLRLGTNIIQTVARTPAMTAMTAMTLDLVTDGRFVLGIGPSGPQVAEGWHGVPFDRPLGRTREYVSILRQVFTRERTLVHEGAHYQIPADGAGTTGLGKPLKSMLGARPDIPILLAGIGPRTVATATEIADGLILSFMGPEQCTKIYGEAIAAARSPAFEVVCTVDVAIGDDFDQCRDAVRPRIALYVGGMGARAQNFYTDLFARLGYETEARRIQDLYLAGRVAEAQAAVTDEMVDEVALVGPPGRIREQLDRWNSSPVTTLVLNTNDLDILEAVTKLTQ